MVEQECARSCRVSLLAENRRKTIRYTDASVESVGAICFFGLKKDVNFAFDVCAALDTFVDRRAEPLFGARVGFLSLVAVVF